MENKNQKEFDITELSPGELEKLLIKVASQVETVGLEYAKAKTNYDNLNETMKSVFAANTPDRIEGVEKPTVQQKENAALLSPDYQANLKALGIARGIYLEKQVLYDAIKIKVDVLRTIISLRKQEMSNRI